jgi:hypothetical protein
MQVIRGDIRREEACATSFDMVWTYPVEALEEIGS